MFTSKAIIIFIFVMVFMAIIIGVYFYPLMFFATKPTTTSTTTNEGIIISNASGFEISPGTTTTLQIEIDSQNFSIKASNNVFPIFGIQFIAPLATFSDAVKIAYKTAGLNTLDEIKLDYESGKMIYTVFGHAKDSFRGFELENFRIIVVADNGDVISINKESLFVSFLKKLFTSTIKTWQ